ncbi:MAG: type I secretion C-terminal target domain-containing protein, partial [Rhizobiales bacterium]|nr:type I secretion C-terminal target domain-containing protein [Rhizobacter sp.]
ATAVAAAGTTFAGLYGDLVLRGDGSYSYVANRADAVATGTSASDVFTYRVADGQGGTSTATLAIAVGGQADTLSAPAPTTSALTSTLGLSGEYYGYNDFNPSGANANRRHSDDGTVGNLDSVADFNALVNLRNAAKGGSGAILGSSTAALVDTADATFLARTIDYGGAPTVTNSLGSNINRAAGASTAGLTDANSALFKFLNRTGTGGSDAGSLAIRAGTADNDAAGAGPTAGLGTTSDAGIRLTGQVYLEAGVYDIRVTADDGYRLKLQNNTVAMFDGIQSPTTRVYSGVGVEGGLTPLELTYWEQGGNAVLKIEYKLAGTADSTYAVLGANAQPLFSDLSAPTLADNQHIVAGATPGTWLVQTGSVLDGGVGNDTLTGNTGSDLLRGGVGNDVLAGGAGADVLIGGKGNDTMNGGTGHDVFRWSLGDGGSAGTPALDTINGFDNTNYAGDRLDLRDLLVGEDHLFNTITGGGATAGTNALTINGNAGNLGDYLHFSSSAGNTVLEISSTGGFAGGFNSAAVDQVITITGTNLTAGFASDNAVITDLLQRGKLVTDGH